MMGKHSGLGNVVCILLVVGGLNWGLRIFGYDIETWGLGMTLVKIVYALIGLAALYETFAHFGMGSDKHNM